MRKLLLCACLVIVYTLFLFTSSCSKKGGDSFVTIPSDHPNYEMDGLILSADIYTLCTGGETKLNIHSERGNAISANVEWKTYYGSIDSNGIEATYHAPSEIPQAGVDRIEAEIIINGKMTTLSTYILLMEKETSRSWVQTNGPTGGVIHTIEIDQNDSDTLYAGGQGGAVYKSENSGEEWRALTQITEIGDSIYDILLPKKEKNVVYAAAGSGLYKSTNGGESWSRIEGEAGDCPTAVAIHLHQDRTLAIGDCTGRVFLSEDGGENWEKISSGIAGDKPINNIAIANIDTLWASYRTDQSGELFRTNDRGGNWERIDIGKPDYLGIHAIYIDSLDENSIYVGTYNVYNERFLAPEDHPMFVSHDGGNTWQPNTSIEREWLDRHLAVIGRHGPDNALFIATQGRIAKSYDDGETWQFLKPPQPSGDIYDLAVDPNNAEVVYIPRRTVGIIKSTDGGETFKPINKGLRNVSITLLAVPKESGSGDVFAVANGGVGFFRSFDYGNTWENVTEGGITHPWADELTVSPLNPAEVWYTADVGQVFKSTDYGANWDMVIYENGSGFRFGTASVLAVPETNPEILYALKSGFGIFKLDPSEENEFQFLHHSDIDYTYTLAVHPQNPDIILSGYNPKPFQDWAMVRRSTDGGDTWETVLEVQGSYGITSVAFDQTNPDIIYAGSTADGERGGGKIFKSTNGGDTWEELNPHFNMNTVWGQPQLIVHPQDPLIAYAATWLAGTWKTTDAGQNWEKLKNAPLSATSLSVDSQEPDVIYLTDRSAPLLWKSVDSGQNWEIAADFAADGAFLANRVFAFQGKVYLATFGPGIHNGKLYQSSDGGTTWTDITGNLPRSVLDIAVHPQDQQTIYVTTHIYGAYRSDDGGENWQELSGFPDIGGYDIEIDTYNPNILYAAGMGGGSVPEWVMPPNGYTFNNTSGVYKSTNGGSTWKQLLETSNESRAVRLHPDDPEIVFTSAMDDGMQISMDGGTTWQSFNIGLHTKVLTSVAVAGDKVYAGTQAFGIYSGDFDMENQTIIWPANRGNKPRPPVYNLQIKIDPTNPQRIYVGSNPGGLYRSDDGGTTFYDKNFLTPSVVVDDPLRQGYYTFAINSQDPQEVWVGTWGKGIFKSYDGMDFNTPASGGQDLIGKHINAILISPQFGVLAATEEGMYRSEDDGAGWKEFNEGMGVLQVRSIVETPDGRLLCGTAGYEIFEYIENGEWEQFQDFSQFGTFWTIWNNRPMYQYTSMLFHPSNPDILFFGTFPAGIFMSTDRGETWRESNIGWTNDGVFSLIYHPQNENIIYAGTYNGVNRSLDGGEHWEKWDTGWPGEQWVFSIDFDPLNPDIMYACSKNGENMGVGREGFHGTVMKSIDGGKNWYPITEGLDIAQEFYKIIVDRFDPQTIYLATQFDGVYISYDSGESWIPWNEGLTNPIAGSNGNNVTNVMVLSEDGLHLYFGSDGSGAFRRLTDHVASLCNCD